MTGCSPPLHWSTSLKLLDTMAFLWGTSQQQQEFDQLLGASPLPSLLIIPPHLVTPLSLSHSLPCLPSHADPARTTEKCTSDLLPASTPLDLPDALTLSDHLRSASVSPSSALPALLKRLNHDNPNVQLLALSLFDVLLKNGGTSFLALLAKPAAQGGAATDFELLASGRKSGGVNREVGQESRKLLQEWAEAFKASGKKELEGSQLVEVYERLKREPGVEFPKLDRGASKAMVESLSVRPSLPLFRPQ